MGRRLTQVPLSRPPEDGWKGGDRTFTCYVSHVDDSPLTATVKGTKQ